MSKKRPLISIVTATHNRCSYLKILYNSLKLQNYKNIEWIVGNDGSTDNTDKVIKLFIKEKKIKIKYIKSDLRIGKTKIDNLIFPLVSGEYQCACGSDDYFKKDAFKNMSVLLKKIPRNLDNKINGLITQSVDTKGISQTFYKYKIPKKDLFMSWENCANYLKGDATLLEKSTVYKNKKFKEVDFLISESTLMNKIHKNKLFLISPIVTKVMRRAKDSISFGSTLRYCRGYAHSIAINLDKKKFSKLSLSTKVFIFLNYWRYVWHGDINFSKAKKMWIVTKQINIYYLFFPLIVLLILKDKLFKDVEKTHIQFEKNKNKSNVKYNNL